MTSQEQLENYSELRETAKEATAAVERAKREIVAGFDGTVEPGAFKCKVEERGSQSFSYDAMVDAVGRLQADRIKSLLPVRHTTFLFVTGP
jgi:hypothetical protein